MTKMFCDGCNRERMPQEAYRRLAVPCHLAEAGIRGYVNPEGVPVSGRMVDYDLCPRCYNTVMGAAVAKLNELREIPQ